MSDTNEAREAAELMNDSIAEAIALLDAIDEFEPNYDQTIALAQAHATLALALATRANAKETRKLRLLIDHSMNVAGVEGEFLEWLDRAKVFEDRVNELERENMALRSEMEKKR